MPRLDRDPSLPADGSERKRELARRRQARRRELRAGGDVVELEAARLRAWMDAGQRRRLIELLTAP